MCDSCSVIRIILLYVNLRKALINIYISRGIRDSLFNMNIIFNVINLKEEFLEQYDYGKFNYLLYTIMYKMKREEM